MTASKFGMLGLMASSRQGLLGLARQYERAGADAFFWGDHLQTFPYAIWKPELVGPLATFVPDPNQNWDAIATLAAVGTATEQLRVGVCATEATRRHPATLAQEWLTLHHLTEGRAILGIGPGEAENIIPYGIAFDRPVGRMEEAIKIIRLLWESKGPVSYDGEFWKLEDAVNGLGAYEGTYPPIWTVGLGPRGLRITGELADGWFPWRLARDEFAEKRTAILNAASKVGRNIDDFTWGQLYVTMVGNDHEAIHKALFSSYLCKWIVLIEWGPESFQKYGLEHPLRRDYRGIIEYLPNAFSDKEYLKAIEVVPDEMVHDYFLHGTPDDIVAELREHEKVGVNYHILADASGFGDPTMAAEATPHFETILAECSR